MKTRKEVYGNGASIHLMPDIDLGGIKLSAGDVVTIQAFTNASTTTLLNSGAYNSLSIQKEN